MILIGIILNSVSKIGNIKDMMVSGVFHKLVMQHGLTTRGQNPDFHNHSSTEIEVADVVERIEKQKVYNDG
jgi:hypothetical protein